MRLCGANGSRAHHQRRDFRERGEIRLSPRKAVDEELSKQKILQVARELFVSQGYRAVSMRSIARKLGYSHGALYYHFKEKAELFSTLVATDFANLSALLDRILQEPSPDQTSLLEKVFVAYIRFGLEHKPHYEIMFLIEDPELRQYALAEKKRSYEKFAAVVLKAMREAGIKRNDVLMYPWLAFLSLHGFVCFYLHTDQTFDDVRKLAETHAGLLARSLLDDSH